MANKRVIHKIINNVKVKQCSWKYGCNEWKPLSEFGKTKISSDNLISLCKICYNKHQNQVKWDKGLLNRKEWIKQNNQKFRKYINGIEHKRCSEKSGCNQWLPLNYFSKRKNNSYHYICKNCDKKRVLEIRRANGIKPVKETDYSKKPAPKLINGVLYQKCSGKNGCNEWKPICKFLKDSKTKYKHQYTCNSCKAKMETERKKTDIQFKLKKRLRAQVRGAIKRKNLDVRNISSTELLLECSVSFFKNYLESLFSESMNWKNYGNGKSKWNIDHIMPYDYFSLENSEERKICFHYTNLQPLWFVDNIRKYNKLDFLGVANG